VYSRDQLLAVNTQLKMLNETEIFLAFDYGHASRVE